MALVGIWHGILIVGRTFGTVPYECSYMLLTPVVAVYASRSRI